MIRTISISMSTALLDTEAAWQVESFLLRIFEYCDYSLRSALSGEYSKTLNCAFFVARHEGRIVGAAGCLYGRNNPSIAIVGPIGVDQQYRGNGIGTRLINSIIEHLRDNGCLAAYLGISAANPAVRLYDRAGFKKYHGIIMRLLTCPDKDFEEEYFAASSDVTVRQVQWGDFPAINSLFAVPCNLYTIDLNRGIFSTKYVEPIRFLPLFPEMMKAFSRYGGFANVLVAGRKENIVGCANIQRLPGKAQSHVAYLDFCVHDNFVDRGEYLLTKTLNESNRLKVSRINISCLACDKIKRDIIEACGAVQIARLPKNVFVAGVYEDVMIFQF